MNKKVLYSLITVVVLIVLVVGLYFIFGKKAPNLEYTDLTLDEIKTTVRVGMPKDVGIVASGLNVTGNGIDFINEDKGYKIESRVYQKKNAIYDDNKERSSKEEGYEEIEINKYKGYQVNASRFSKRIEISLAEENGAHNIYQLFVSRTRDYDEPLEELMNLEEVKTLIKSFKVVDYVGNTEDAK